MKYKTLLVSILLFLNLNAYGEQQYATLQLHLGEQRLLHYPKLLRYSLQSPAVRATIPPIKNSGKMILIKAVQVGEASLWVSNQDGSTFFQPITVYKSESKKQPSSLLIALSKLTEVEVVSTGPGFILRGAIQTSQEAAKVRALLVGSSQDIIDETTISELLIEKATLDLQAYLQKSRYKNQLRIETIGGSIWIRGSLKNATERKTLERELRNIFPKIEMDYSSLPDHQPTISFKVFLIELRKTAFTSLGLSWPHQVQSAFKVSPGGLSKNLNLELAIQALEGKGSAKILSRPELAVRAPGEAELFAGGELPIKIKTQHSYNILWKSFGLSLKLNVSHVTLERVRLDIQTEVSHLDEKISVDDIPGIQASRLKTQVDAEFNTPLFLSGLLQEGVREQARGLPWLRHIPVLGLLFGSEDFLNDRSELVAILLPRMETSPPPIKVRVSP